MLLSELVMWETFWTEKFDKELPNSIAKTLRLTDSGTFSNIYVALKILAVLPVTRSCERSVSAIRRLKTYLRSTMSQNRLNELAAMYIHKEINLDIDTVLDKFARKHPRRLELINILDTDKDRQPPA